MAVLRMPADLAAFVAARIANYEAEATEPYHLWEAPEVVRFGALPLLRHWEETIGLRPDGAVVRWATLDHREPYPDVLPAEDRIDWLAALVEGSLRYPELGALLPVRSATARACWCVGQATFAPGRAICPACCGLRWVDLE